MKVFTEFDADSDEMIKKYGIRKYDENQYILSGEDISVEDVKFSGARGASEMHEDGKPYHTFRTFTLMVDGKNIRFKNCEFENTIGSGSEFGQAIALYLDGDDIILENCVIKGYQDSLFLAPLPPKEYEKDGFLGPGQFTPRKMRSFIFNRCRIEGSVDFVFGGAKALFKDCEFVSVEKGWIFAPCTPEGSEEGFVAENCRFTHTESVPEGSCHIGRPWREFAKIKLINCYLGDHIASAGWDDWGKEKAHETVCFEEIGSYGPGADPAGRPSWVKVRSC